MEERGRSRLHPVGDGETVAVRSEGKVGEFIVQQEAAHHQAGAEGVFDGRGHRQHVAVAVDDAEVRGGGKLDRLVIGPVQRVIEVRLARGDLGQRVIAGEQFRPVSQIDGVGEALGGHRDEIAVGHVAAAVGEGEAGGVADQPPGLRAVRTGQVVVLQHPEDLPHGERAGGRRAHAADLMRAVTDADGRAFAHLVERQIDLAEHAGVAGCLLHHACDVGGDGAGIEGRCPLPRQAPQRVGVGGVGQRRALGQRGAAGQEIGGGGGEARQPLCIPLHQTGEAGRDGKALLGEVDGVVEERGPGAAAPAAMRRLHQRRCTGRADGAAADDRIEEFERFARVVLEQRRGGRERRGFAAVEGGQRAGCRIVPDQEGAAAEAGALRFHQPQHRLCGDHRIGGRAARRKDRRPCLHRVGVGGGDHPVLCRDRAACLFRRQRLGYGRRYGGENALGRGFRGDRIGALLGRERGGEGEAGGNGKDETAHRGLPWAGQGEL